MTFGMNARESAAEIACQNARMAVFWLPLAVLLRCITLVGPVNIL